MHETLFCSAGRCHKVRGRRGPYCTKHGCSRCGDEVTPVLAAMKEPLCATCYEAERQVPAMKKHPSAELLFHVAIEVESDKLHNEELRRRVLPGLVRSDGKTMDVGEFRRMCRKARERGFIVLPACTNINQSGQCMGHDAPKIDITTIAEAKERAAVRDEIDLQKAKSATRFHGLSPDVLRRS